MVKEETTIILGEERSEQQMQALREGLDALPATAAIARELERVLETQQQKEVAEQQGNGPTSSR